MTELADIIAPIVPPDAPPPYEWIALGVALFALILFFVLRLWLKRTRARRTARAALKRTERDLQHGTLDARTAAFQIARALKCSPPLPALSPSRGRGEDLLSAAAWTEFTQALDRARFSPHPIDIQQAVQLLAQARQWIGRAP